MGDALMIRTEVAIAFRTPPATWADQSAAERYLRYLREWTLAAAEVVYDYAVPFTVTTDWDQLRQQIDTVLTRASQNTRRHMVTVPDFKDLAKRSMEGSLSSRSAWLRNEKAEWCKHDELEWTLDSRRGIPDKDVLNPGPIQHHRKLVNWVRKHSVLLGIARASGANRNAGVQDIDYRVQPDIDWRVHLRTGTWDRWKRMPNRDLIRHAKNLQEEFEALKGGQEEAWQRKGDHNGTIEYIDLDWLDATAPWVDLPAEYVTITGDPDKGVPRTTQEVMAANAEKMKNLLANAKTETNFTPAPPPAELLPVQIPIYDRGAQGFRILNRVWTAGQRLAFIKHVLDTMSGVPIFAQELDVLSASGNPVPDNAVLVEWDVAWRCSLTGLFHDPRDVHFLADLDGCFKAYALDHQVNGNDHNDPWYTAHQPWYLMAPGYASDPDSRYWYQVGPQTQLAAYKQRNDR